MAHLYLPFPTERNGMQSTDRNQTKGNFRSVRFGWRLPSVVFHKMAKVTDGNPQPNRTERKFPFRSVTLCRLHSIPFRSAEKGECRFSFQSKRAKLSNFLFFIDLSVKPADLVMGLETIVICRRISPKVT
uniref:Uncharacterized protein n=1 Tax=Romanomermis culicivorax TaxID=13658 RepID=A0A915KB65_ROMCU